MIVLNRMRINTRGAFIRTAVSKRRPESGLNILNLGPDAADKLWPSCSHIEGFKLMILSLFPPAFGWPRLRYIEQMLHQSPSVEKRHSTATEAGTFPKP